MNHKPRTKVTNIRVDWSDPKLESLLRRSENWSLDNRGGHTPQDVEVYLGWSATVGRSARLVWERDQSIVVLTNFPIAKGEHVRLDKHLGDSIRTLWGVAVDGRESNREEDREQGLHVYWLQIR